MLVLIEVLTNQDNESIIFIIQSTQKLIGSSGYTEPKVQRVNCWEVSRDRSSENPRFSAGADSVSGSKGNKGISFDFHEERAVVS